MPSYTRPGVLTYWRRADEVLVEGLGFVDAVRPDENVALGQMTLSFVIAADERCCICRVRPVRSAQRFSNCYPWRRRNGRNQDGRLFPDPGRPSLWVRHSSELAREHVA
jgi:hypothetical protein